MFFWTDVHISYQQMEAAAQSPVIKQIQAEKVENGRETSVKSASFHSVWKLVNVE